MGYDCGDSFIFDFEPNEIPFDSKSIGKLSPQPYPIRFENKWKYSFLSVQGDALYTFEIKIIMKLHMIYFQRISFITFIFTLHISFITFPIKYTSLLMIYA